MPNVRPKREAFRQELMELQSAVSREGTPTLQAAVLRVTTDAMEMLNSLQRIESETRHFALTRDAAETLRVR
jgi:hypothetical protein